MDKTAQAARQARLAQALRTNLRRRKSADGRTGAASPDPAADVADVNPPPARPPVSKGEF